MFNISRFSKSSWHQQVARQDPDALYAPHFDAKRGRYFNPWYINEKNWRDIIKFFLEKNRYQPSYHDVPTHSTSSWHPNFSSDASLTMLGHSSLALQINSKLLLLDPFLSKYAFNIKRCQSPAIDIQALPDNSIVIISHNHYDHLDKSTITRLSQATFICPLGVGSLLSRWGAQKIYELDWWQDFFYDDIKFICLPAHHWSRRLNQGTNRSLWSSWLLEVNGHRIYFGGDSAYFVGYREFGRCFPGIDLALLPCGAFAPRWFMHQSHLDVEEMFMAFNDMQARHLVPIHWGSIMLGHEPACEPFFLIKRYLQENPELAQRVHSLNVADSLILWP